MKKLMILCCLMFVVSAAVFAQEEEQSSKKATIKELPEGWLPQAGDWAISIDATPLLQYIGNVASAKTNNTLDDFGATPYSYFNDPSAANAAPEPSVSIMAKYMLSDQLAVRANVGLLIDVYNQSIFVKDDLKAIEDPLLDAKVTDRYKQSNTGVSLALGAEYRVGKRKVQGVFGGSLFAAFNKRCASFTYGNAITEINQAPSSNNWVGNINTGIDPYSTQDRLLKDNGTGVDSYLGVIGHVGIEYFFAPKISLGGEVNLSLYGSMLSRRSGTSEVWNPLSNELETWTEVLKPKASGFHFGTENIGANVFVHFYF